MDHAFELVAPEPRCVTVTMRRFRYLTWPSDLIDALDKLARDKTRGGARGSVTTAKLHTRTDAVAGDFEIEGEP